MEIDWYEQWVEVVVVLFAVLGFILSILLANSILSYLTIIVSGVMAGRIYYTKRFEQPILPFVLIIAGFLLGYFIGGFWISRFWAMVFFLASFYTSYKLHMEKIFVIFKSKHFVK